MGKKHIQYKNNLIQLIKLTASFAEKVSALSSNTRLYQNVPPTCRISHCPKKHENEMNFSKKLWSSKTQVFSNRKEIYREILKLYVTLATSQDASVSITSTDTQCRPVMTRICWTRPQPVSITASTEGETEELDSRGTPPSMWTSHTKILLPPSNSRGYKVPESHILSRALH